MSNDTYSIIYAKILISTFFCLMAFLSFQFQPKLEKVFDKIGQGKAFTIFVILFRLIPFSIVYLLLGYKAQSDVYIFWRSAQEASHFKLVYRDFESLYSPFFPYITGTILYLWDSAEAITLLMVLVEIAVLWLSLKTYRSENKAKDVFKVLVYLLLPAPLIFCVIGGQEDIWMWGFACLFVYFSQEKASDFVLGIITALGLLCTKAFFVLLIPLIFLKINDKVKFILGNLSLGIPVFLFLFYFGGFSFLMPIRLAQEPMSPNFWSLVHPFVAELDIIKNTKILNWIGLILILSFATWQSLRTKEIAWKTYIPSIWILIFGTMMLIQIGSYANYLFIYSMPLIFCFDFIKQKKFVFITFFIQFIASFQPSLWFRIGKPFLRFEQFKEFRFVLEYSLEIIILAGVCYWLNWVIQKKDI